MTKENISNTSNFKIPLFRLNKIPSVQSIKEFLKDYDSKLNSDFGRIIGFEGQAKVNRKYNLHASIHFSFSSVEVTSLELSIIEKAEIELKYTEVLDYKFKDQKSAELAYSMDEETLARNYDGKFSVFRLTDKDGNICDPLTYVILIKEGKLYYGIL